MSNLPRDKLLEAMAKVAEFAPPRFDTMLASDRFAKKCRKAADEMVIADAGHPQVLRTQFFGFKLVPIPEKLAPRRPVLQISPEFEHCSPEFRAEWNRWALERFGTEEVCYLVNERALAAVLRGEFERMERELICNGVVQLRNVT